MPVRSKHLITIAAVAFSSIVCAQMPVPLLDNEPAAPNAALWAVAGPMLQAALECREDLPDHPATRALLPRKPAGEEQHYRLTPPSGFKVFGLPVAEIEVWVDDGDGELGICVAAAMVVYCVVELEKAWRRKRQTSASAIDDPAA